MVTPTEDYYPDHDGGKFAPIEATTVATWKAPAFLENLAIDAEGAVFVTVYSHNRVDRYDPAVTDAWNVIAFLLKSGAIKPIVAKTFPLTEAAAALRYLVEGRPFGRVVLTI